MNKTIDFADIVVYGTIRTAEADGQVAEALAIKDGKFIYVGDKASVKDFIKEGVTEVIDHTGKGMVMPGCFEGHAHYLQGLSLEFMGGLTLDPLNDGVDSFFEKLKLAYADAKKKGKSCIFGFGWNYFTFLAQGMPTREQLDAVCPDVAVFIHDSEGHKSLSNSVCLRNAGIIDAEGNILKGEIRGGKICMDANGKPDGLLLEQAVAYVRNRGLNFDEILTEDATVQATLTAQQMLLANGYVSYMDGWSNFFGTPRYYEVANKLDAAGKLNMLLGMTYEFDSSCDDIDAELVKAVEGKKYTKGHVNANYVKLFIDGTVEGGTGLTMEPYPDGHPGIANWEEDEVTYITGKANAQGLTMHIHTMGDGAVHRCVNAFVTNGTKEARNTLVHVRNMPQEDFQRVADNDIVVVSGMLWHVLPDEVWEQVRSVTPASVSWKSYPMKSYFDNGIVMTSHCDFPATSGSPYDPFGIMEIAVTGSAPYPGESGRYTRPWWTEELITREQALQALTINGAYQMQCETERGSIKVGKYADFLLVDKDVFECAVTDIHNAKVVATYFEGEKVYGNK
ncbi:MAG: amidohydrolase family protein [Bacteroidaceae bacterium]|nr:amidohydrolase family protein [Bacteroidaceae bacterium]